MRARNGNAEEPLYFICQLGGRSQQACEMFQKKGFNNVVSVEGGTKACEKTDLPLVRGKKAISLERQVRIVAGSLVMIGVVLGWLVHPALRSLRIHRRWLVVRRTFRHVRHGHDVSANAMEQVTRSPCRNQQEVECLHQQVFDSHGQFANTRTPVAWWTASVIAAAMPARPISPIPRAPSSLISLSG